MIEKKINLKNLGKKSISPNFPEITILEKIPNPKKNVSYIIRLSCPEFTSLCPVTNQPDFGHLVIDYLPNKWLVESKSLKLYLQGYRNHGAFHEDCSISIAQDLLKTLKPSWLRIGAYWFPRGGIPIDIFWQTGPNPKNIYLPDQNIPVYKGRF
tara:strand:+ start:684 stop:1145 length:462 start_codon:yes stop_codon:yes gene_type:complete